mgnify:CR=1 FL=1
MLPVAAGRCHSLFCHNPAASQLTTWGGGQHLGPLDLSVHNPHTQTGATICTRASQRGPQRWADRPFVGRAPRLFSFSLSLSLLSSSFPVLARSIFCTLQLHFPLHFHSDQRPFLCACNAENDFLTATRPTNRLHHQTTTTLTLQPQRLTTVTVWMPVRLWPSRV